MPGPARAGVLIYAKDLEKVTAFYEHVLAMKRLHANAEHAVLASADAQLIVHAIPPQYAAGIVIAVPPEPREEQAIKPFFTVARLADAEREVDVRGGRVCGPVWPGPGFTVRNVCDPEGNIVQIRELAGS